MKMIFAAACLVGAFAFSTSTSTSPSVGAGAPVALAGAPAQLLEEAEPLAFCPMRWTCDSTSIYYALLAACESDCGAGQCYREPFCQPGCICP